MYEITAPNTPVFTSVDYPPPHSTSQPVDAIGLNQVAHYARLYEVVGGVLGSMIAEEKVQPTAETIQTPGDIELTVGATPADELAIDGDNWDGSADYPQYIGKIAKINYRIIQRGIGPLRDDEYADDSSGGTAFKWKLLNGATFNDQDTYWIQFLPSIIINPANYQVSTTGVIQDIITLTVDTTLTNTHVSKLIDINSATNKITITLLPIADWSEMRPISFITRRGSQINAVIKAQAGEKIYWDGQEVNQIVLGKNENLRLLRKDNRIYVEDAPEARNQVGEVVYAYKQPRNTIPADGSVLQRDVYVSATEFALSLLPGQGVVTEAEWNSDNTTHRGKWTLGDGVTTVRVPDLRGVAIRGLDDGRGLDTMRTADNTENVIASYQADGNKKHGHSIKTTNSGASSSSGTDPIRGNNIGDANDRGQAGANKTISEEGNLEATMKNVALKPFIRI